MAIDDSAKELTAVAPILAKGELIASCTFVASGGRTIGIASAERLRSYHGTPLVVATKLDGSKTIPVASWSMSFGGLALVELGAPLSDEITALDVGAVCATVETHGAPSALVVIGRVGNGFVRHVIRVDTDRIEGDGMSDVITRLASPREATTVEADGGVIFAWFPAVPALGRPQETVLVALGVGYRHAAFKPRDQPALVELIGLEDLGRALRFAAPAPEARDKVVVGEITPKP